MSGEVLTERNVRAAYWEAAKAIDPLLRQKGWANIEICPMPSVAELLCMEESGPIKPLACHVIRIEEQYVRDPMDHSTVRVIEAVAPAPVGRIILETVPCR